MIINHINALKKCWKYPGEQINKSTYSRSILKTSISIYFSHTSPLKCMEICLVLPVDLRWTILTGSKHPVLKALSPSTFQLGVPNGSRWLVGRVLSFRDRYPSLSVDFLFRPSVIPPPPTSMLLGKGRGGGWNVSLGGWKLFSRSCGRRVPLNHCLPRSTPEMSETAITWTLHVFCQNLLIKVHRPHWERKRPVKFDLSHLQNLVLVLWCIMSALEKPVNLFFGFICLLKHRVDQSCRNVHDLNQLVFLSKRFFFFYFRKNLMLFSFFLFFFIICFKYRIK